MELAVVRSPHSGYDQYGNAYAPRAAAVRRFLSSLLGANLSPEDAETAHKKLGELAGNAIPGAWRKVVDANDLVSEFTLRMLKTPATARAEDVRELMDLEDRPLLGAIAHRFFQLSSERGARAEGRKAMREHVKEVWDGVEAHNGPLPATIFTAHRISSRLVAEAVGHLLGTAAFVGASPNAVADHLLDVFSPAEETLETVEMIEEGSCGTQLFEAFVEYEPAEALGRKMDAHDLAMAIAEKLGPELSDIVARRLREQTLQQIADARGLNSPAAVFNRLARAQSIIRACFTQAFATDRTSLLAVELLAATSGIKKAAAFHSEARRWRNSSAKVEDS